MVVGNSASVEVDLVGDVVPFAGGKVGLPLTDTSNHPLQAVVAGRLLTADEAVLHLRKVRLEEAHLVLLVLGWWVHTGVLHAEVVVHLALVDGSGGLGDQLGAKHSIIVPNGGLVKSNLDTLLRAAVGRVLVGGVQVDVVGDRASAVDVVLIRSDLVREAPYARIRVRILQVVLGCWMCVQLFRSVLEVMSLKRPSQRTVPTSVSTATVAAVASRHTSHGGANQGTESSDGREHFER